MKGPQLKTFLMSLPDLYVCSNSLKQRLKLTRLLNQCMYILIRERHLISPCLQRQLIINTYNNKNISPFSLYLCGQAPHGQLHQTETFGVLPLHVCVCCSAIVRGNHAEVKEGQER